MSAWAASRWRSLLGDASGTAAARLRPARDQSTRESRRRHFAARAKQVIFLHMAGGPSQLGAVRLQAGAGEARRPAVPGGVLQGPAVRVHQGPPEAAGHDVPVRPTRPERQRGSRSLLPHLSSDRRRPDDRPLDDDRAVQPRAGAAAHAHGQPAVGPGVARRLGHVRAGHAEPGSAGVHGARVRRQFARRRQERVGQRLSCRASIRACSAARRATRSCSSTIRPA